MLQITLRELNEKYGGVLPPDATLLPETELSPALAPANVKRREQRGDRFAVLNSFVDVGMADLPASEVKVWLVLFRDTKAATGTARTGQVDIARRTGLCPRSVRYGLTSLEKKGMIRIVRRGRLNAGASVYQVRSTPSAIA